MLYVLDISWLEIEKHDRWALPSSDNPGAGTRLARELLVMLACQSPLD